jgi:GAF domain-containing protein
VTNVAQQWDRARAFIARQPGAASQSGNVAERLRRICGAAAKALPATGVGVSVMTESGVRGFAAASDASSQQVEELQYALGEGPCVDAFASRRPVLESELGTSGMARWPMYAAAVHNRGVRAVFAFPLQVGAARVGVLDVFRDQPGAMTDEEVAQALVFAEIALHAVLDGQNDAPPGAVPEGLDEPPVFRAEISQAQGMIMVQLGVTIAEALVRLRAYAYAEARPLADVARDVVARKLRFDETLP